MRYSPFAPSHLGGHSGRRLSCFGSPGGQAWRGGSLRVVCAALTRDSPGPNAGPGLVLSHGSNGS
jgi:hypothetical protein